MRLAEHQVQRPRMLTLRQIQYIHGTPCVALFEVVFDDDLELLYIEEKCGVLSAHRLVSFHTIVELVVPLGVG